MNCCCSRLALSRGASAALPLCTATQRRGYNAKPIALISPFTICKPPIMPPDSQRQWPRRPPRLGRLFDTARPFYFVTFNTYKRHSFLAQPEVHEAFCVFCSKAQEHDVAVGRYVIMPNHIHLSAAFPMASITLAGWI